MDHNRPAHDAGAGPPLMVTRPRGLYGCAPEMTSPFRKAHLDAPSFTLPGRFFTSDDVFAAEHDRIFAGGWIAVGRAEQISAPGDYLLVDVGRENLIIVRGRDGTLRAHYNVCRHRGTRLCTEAEGRLGETIQCPYHAWTYALDGRLLAARNMADAPGFDKAAHSLHGAAIVEWEGFLMLDLAKEPTPFAQAFAPLMGRFDRWTLAGLRRGGRIAYDVAANWKLIVANYSECYHCPIIHPTLVELSAWQSGCNDLDEGPFLGGPMDLTRHSMTVGGATARPPLVGLTEEDRRRVYYYSVFPNLLLSLHPDYVMAHVLQAIAPGRTKITCEWYFEPSTMAAPGFDASDAMDFWDEVNRQDFRVCELMQLGVGSRAYTPGPYAQAEGLLAAFDRYYREVMGVEGP